MRVLAMAILTLSILALTAIAMTSPTCAQTYNPRYPICLKVIQNFGGERYECAYESIEQCRQSQGGLPAQCVVNPYYRGRR